MSLPADIDLAGILGKGKYLSAPRFNNYYLDMEEVDMFGSGYTMINGVANMFFDGVWNLGYNTISIFNTAMSFDAGELLQSKIGGIQEALNKGIFQPMFAIAFLFTGFTLVKNVLRRDASSVVSDLAKVIMILILSYFVVSNSAAVLSGATNITKELGASIVTGMNDGKGKSEAYGKELAGVLWGSLVHDPYVFLEFGEMVDDEIVEKVLSYAPHSKERKKFIKEYREGKLAAYSKDQWDSAPVAFGKNYVGGRIGMIAVYLIPMIARCCLYIFVSLIQILFQVMAVFYVLLAPIILILALTPFYGSTELINTWIKKMLETQLSILVIMLVLGLIIWLDSVVNAWLIDKSWYLVAAMQAFITVGVVLGRKQIFSLVTEAGRSINTQGYVRSRLARGDGALETTGSLAGSAAQRYDEMFNRKNKTSTASSTNTNTTANRTTTYSGNMLKNVPQLNQSRVNANDAMYADMMADNIASRVPQLSSGGGGSADKKVEVTINLEGNGGAAHGGAEQSGRPPIYLKSAKSSTADVKMNQTGTAAAADAPERPRPRLTPKTESQAGYAQSVPTPKVYHGGGTLPEQSEETETNRQTFKPTVTPVASAAAPQPSAPPTASSSARPSLAQPSAPQPSAPSSARPSLAQPSAPQPAASSSARPTAAQPSAPPTAQPAASSSARPTLESSAETSRPAVQPQQSDRKAGSFQVTHFQDFTGGEKTAKASRPGLFGQAQAAVKRPLWSGRRQKAEEKPTAKFTVTREWTSNKYK